MNANLLVTLLVLTVLAAGCATPQQSLSTTSASSLTPSGRVPPGANATVREIRFASAVDQYVSGFNGLGGIPPNCAPYPGECAPNYNGYMEFTGDWKGRASYVGQTYYNFTTLRVEDYYNPITFTGSLGACGTGTFTMTARGHIDQLPVVAGANSGAHINVTLRMVTGSASIGFSGLKDVVGYFDMVNPLIPNLARFPLTGKMSCAAAAPA